MLGDAFEIHNYGVNSVTAIRDLNPSYDKTQAFQQSIALDADIYLLMLGTNDAKFWSQHSHKFAIDMEWTIQQARATRPVVDDSSPATRIILAIPPWVKMDYGEIKNDILNNYVQPAIREFASAQQIQLVDMYQVTFNRFDFYIGDNLHLNAKGYRTLSRTWKRAIVCNHNDVCETGENCETCPQDCRLNCP
jgi:lysophospholipase L1-like esterase